MPRLCLLCERIFGNEVRRGETPVFDKMYPKTHPLPQPSHRYHSLLANPVLHGEE